MTATTIFPKVVNVCPMRAPLELKNPVFALLKTPATFLASTFKMSDSQNTVRSLNPENRSDNSGHESIKLLICDIRKPPNAIIRSREIIIVIIIATTLLIPVRFRIFTRGFSRIAIINAKMRGIKRLLPR